MKKHVGVLERARLVTTEMHELYRSKEARDAAMASGVGETFEQLDEVLVTLGARVGPS